MAWLALGSKGHYFGGVSYITKLVSGTFAEVAAELCSSNVSDSADPVVIFSRYLVIFLQSIYREV